MLLSLFIIIIAGLAFGWIFKKLHLPAILGMLLTGIIFGPNVLNLFDKNILSISADIREIALIIILAKAGLSIDISDLKKIGRPAVMMCFMPATFELLAFVIFAPKLMGLTVLESAILGTVMGAVSPATVVPFMTKMMDGGWGSKKGIPQMIIAGSSAGSVYVIVIFTALIALAGGEKVSAESFLQIPISMILGIMLGVALGLVLAWLFKQVHIRDTVKVLIILAISFALAYQEKVLTGIFSISGLLAVMSMCIMINDKRRIVAKRLNGKFEKLWVGAEILLFVLVGTSVDVKHVLSAGIVMVVMLTIGLVFRSIGTLISVFGIGLSQKEKLFCVIAEIPKATVQAAIGGVALSKGLACGNTVLSLSVISILITAPLGSFLIEKSYQKLCSREKAENRNKILA